MDKSVVARSVEPVGMSNWMLLSRYMGPERYVDGPGVVKGRITVPPPHAEAASMAA
jgi:hypothetical protein